MNVVGMIGLGNIGKRLVPRLQAAGYSVVGWNRSPDKADPLIANGMLWAATPREVAQRSDIVWSCVADTAAVQAIAEGPDGAIAGLRKGQVFVEMSTIAPAVSRSLAEKVTHVGAHMLDCPISGSIGMVETGAASGMVGGDRAIFKRVLPVLNVIGRKVTYVGGNGQAAAMKLAINHNVAVQLQAYAEGIVLAERAGIDRAIAVDIMLNSAVASPLLVTRGRFVLDMPEDVWFNIDMMQKDVKLVLGLGTATETPLPTANVADEILTIARNYGLGATDVANLHTAMLRLAASK